MFPRPFTTMAAIAVALILLHSSLADDSMVRKIRRRKVMVSPNYPAMGRAAAPQSPFPSQTDPSSTVAEQPRLGKHIKVRRRKHPHPQGKPPSPARPLEGEIAISVCSWPSPSSAASTPSRSNLGAIHK